MNENRKQENIGKLVGRTEYGDYYFADYAFDHGRDSVTKDTATALKKTAEPFIGVTGTILRLVSKGEYIERTDLANVIELLEGVWRESVRAGNVDIGLKEWAAEAYECDGDDLIFDLSSYSEGEELLEYLAEIGEIDPEDYCDFCECIGGGRIFGDTKFEKVYDQTLLDRVNRVENDKVSWFDQDDTKGGG